MRAYGVGVYTPKQSRIGHCIFIQTDYIQRKFVFNIGVPRQYLDFFDSLKYRISVFYRESIWSWCIYFKTEKNRALYIFSDRLYSEPFSFNFGAPRYY